MIYMHMQGVEQARQAASVKVAHDARAVHDMASLKLAELLHQGMAQWIVARILPAAQSGYATIPGATIGGRTGQLLNPTTSAPVVMKQGKWEVLSSSGLPAPVTNTYNWTEPLDEDKRVLSPEDYYSPFIKGGVILQGSSLDETLPRHLDAVYLTFDSWAAETAEAFAFVSQHADLFQNANASAVAEHQLVDLLANSNALLKIQAFRQLIASGRVRPALPESSIAAASSEAAAVFTYLVLRDSREQHWEQRLAKVLNSPTKEETCRGIALGAYAANLLSNDTRIAEEAGAVLSAARFRLAASIGTDEYLKVLFEQ